MNINIQNNGIDIVYNVLPDNTIYYITSPSTKNNISVPSGLYGPYNGFKIDKQTLAAIFSNDGINFNLYYTTDLTKTLSLIPNLNISDIHTFKLSNSGNTLVAVSEDFNLYYTTSLSTSLISSTSPTLSGPITFPSNNITFAFEYSLNNNTLVVKGDNSGNKSLYYTNLSTLATPFELSGPITFPSNVFSGNGNFFIGNNGEALVAEGNSGGNNIKLYYTTSLSTPSTLSEVTFPPYISYSNKFEFSKNGLVLVVAAQDTSSNYQLYYTNLSSSSELTIMNFVDGFYNWGSFLLNDNGTVLVAEGIGENGNIFLYYTTDLSKNLILIPIPNGETIFSIDIYDINFIDNDILIPTMDGKILRFNTSNQTFTTVYSPFPIGNICFPKGTPILTDQGLIAIDKIDIEIHTINQKKIVDITKTISKETFLVCFDKDALGIDMPNQETIITQGHQIFYEGAFHEANWFLEKFSRVKSIPYTGEPLYNVLMEKHDVINVNNLICETLRPDNPIAKFYTKQCKLSIQDREIMIKVLQGCLDRNDIDSYNKILQCC